MRPFQAGDRRVRVLQALARHAGGLTLAGCVDAIGLQGRKESRATVVMLRSLRDAGLVGFQEPDLFPLGKRRGPCPGTYWITPLGLDWLEAHGFTPAEGCELVVPTGAMQGDAPLQLQTTAQPGQAPAGAIASVFDLARSKAP